MSQDRELDGTTDVRSGNRRASEVEDETRALIAHSYAALYDHGIGYSVPAQYGATAPPGIVARGGRWLARCDAVNRPGRFRGPGPRLHRP